MANWGETLGEALRLLASKGAFRQLILATERELDGFVPTPDDCHRNTESWVVLHPQHKIVRGFLVVNDYIFRKHSVVDTGLPKLLDITPRNQNESRNLTNFIEFSHALFEAMPPEIQCDLRPITEEFIDSFCGSTKGAGDLREQVHRDDKER